MTRAVPTSNRRSFLGRLSGAAAATIAVSTPALAAVSKAPKPQEFPELLELGARVPDLLAKLHAARDRMIEARAAFERLKPAIPPEIVARQGDRWAVMVREVDNEPSRSEDGYGFVDVYDSKNVRAHIVLHDLSRNTKEGRKLRRIARLAQRFERDHAAAVKASGFREAYNAMGELRFELQNIAEAATAIKPTTSEGIAVYAAIVLAGGGPGAGNMYGDKPEPTLYAALGLEIAKAVTSGRLA